ncbi:MAG: hypothetical protein KQJ78_22960 [Deltaproteobacteria bacterium]|nr:hypothetical protein [Deltaproteobacteria bacterium]
MPFRATCLFALVLLLTPAWAMAAAPADPGWPRVFQKDGRELLVYQPQIDSWENYQKLHLRCAIAVKTGPAAKEKYGVAEITADTVTDHETRTVAVLPQSRELRFPNTSPAEAAVLTRTVDELYPPGRALTVSLDRILAYLDPAKHHTQKKVKLDLHPPRIFYSDRPAILVIFLGQPQFKPVQADNPDFLFALNTNWDVFFDAPQGRYYLRDQHSWLVTNDPVRGNWLPATGLPAALRHLPDNENWSEVRANVPGKPLAEPPQVFVSLKPAELIVTEGEPNYNPIPGTRLMRVSNTKAVVFRDTADRKYYFLAAGRWFRAARLTGPWSAASTDLPADFARIPNDSPSAFVKASVPGTVEAEDAVLLASIPHTVRVNRAAQADIDVTYGGDPKFEPIRGTTVSYAVNSPQAVLLVDGGYYCCDQGVWYCGGSPRGPWVYCTTVPPAIYTIPPSNPFYNVTYVTVHETTPNAVIFEQTAGYSGEYVAATGVLMFGAGVAVGSLWASNSYNYYYPYPVPYSYGCGARYSYAYGGYYRAGAAYYGPYGGAGHYASYNARTGTYSRGAYAYGPAGSVGVRQAYNPYTGTRAWGTRETNPFGSSGRGEVYNPFTGNAVRGGYRSGEHGTAAGVQSNWGTGAAGWNTARGHGGVAKGSGGDVYAGRNGTVYQRNSSGDWSKNTGSGWNPVTRPQPGSGQFNRDNLDSQAWSRQRGGELSQRAVQDPVTGQFRNGRFGGGFGRFSGGGGRFGGGGGFRR